MYIEREIYTHVYTYVHTMCIYMYIYIIGCPCDAHNVCYCVYVLVCVYYVSGYVYVCSSFVDMVFAI